MMMMTMSLLIAGAAAPVSPAASATTASAGEATAPGRVPRWAAGDCAERHRLRDLPPPPPGGSKKLNPLLRITF